MTPSKRGPFSFPRLFAILITRGRRLGRSGSSRYVIIVHMINREKTTGQSDNPIHDSNVESVSLPEASVESRTSMNKIVDRLSQLKGKISEKLGLKGPRLEEELDSYLVENAEAAVDSQANEEADQTIQEAVVESMQEVVRDDDPKTDVETPVAELIADGYKEAVAKTTSEMDEASGSGEHVAEFVEQVEQQMTAREASEKVFQEKLDCKIEDIEKAFQAGDTRVERTVVVGESGKEIPVYTLHGYDSLRFLSHSLNLKGDDEWSKAYETSDIAHKLRLDPSYWDMGEQEASSGNIKVSRTLSTSYIDTGRNPQKLYPGLIYGFLRVEGGSFLNATITDANTRPDVDLAKTQLDIVNPDNLADATVAQNEVLLKRYSENGTPPKPDFIMAEKPKHLATAEFDGIDDLIIKHAEYFGVPIILLDKESYDPYSSQNIMETMNKFDSEISEQSDPDDLFRSLAYIKGLYAKQYGVNLPFYTPNFSYGSASSSKRRDEKMKSYNIDGSEEISPYFNTVEKVFDISHDFVIDAAEDQLSKIIYDLEADNNLGRKTTISEFVMPKVTGVRSDELDSGISLHFDVCDKDGKEIYHGIGLSVKNGQDATDEDIQRYPHSGSKDYLRLSPLAKRAIDAKKINDQINNNIF